jgi:UDPglucose--hexose-1-phosphate uridylyltransferase
LPVHQENCPFCDGTKATTTEEEVARYPSADSWLARCIENKFKIFTEYSLCPIRPSEYDKEGIYIKTEAYGHHEVVIESKIHNHTIANMTITEIKAVLMIYISRFRELRSNPNNLLTLIFKNHGTKAGASQIHPHSQIVGLRVVPNEIRTIMTEAQRHFDSVGICVYCKIISYELQQNPESRVIYRNSNFIAIAPYASEVPYQIHIFPLRHNLSFSALSVTEVESFADCWKYVMYALYEVLRNPDFNIIFRNAPYHLEHSLYWHWHVCIMPRITEIAGLEIGTRIGVNFIPPEEAAKNLRDIDYRKNNIETQSKNTSENN